MEQKPTTHLNLTNPEHILYSTEELQIAVLGGIKLEGLDRLRVTLKMEVANRKFKHYLNNPDVADLALRHNVDLYNDTQVEKLIRRSAERMEVGSSAIAKAIADLTNQLEQHRLKELEKRNVKKEVKQPLTEQEREEGINFLKEPELIQHTNNLIGKSGVIGEEENRILMYLIFLSRKRQTPLHIVSLAASGTGKTYLQEKVSELIPDDEKIIITSLTENALYYFGQHELKHKVILIEDLDGAENVLYPLRELQSKRFIVRTMTQKDSKGQTKTMHIKVEGPICLAGCTTQESIYEDNANRSFLIYLDDSKEQDEKIMEYQRKLSAGTINIDEQNQIKKLLQNTQDLLEPVSIRNPFAELLKIPSEVFKPRRTNAHYLAFIELVTYYYQYQRERKVDTSSGEEYIETTPEDIQVANRLIKHILLRKSDELSGACRNYFERLKEYLQEKKQTTFTNKEIRQYFRLAGTTVRRYHSELNANSYINLQDDKKAKGYIYEVVSYEEYQQLQQRITNVLDETLQNIRQATEPPMSQKQNGSLKPKRTKGGNDISHENQKEDTQPE